MQTEGTLSVTLSRGGDFSTEPKRPVKQTLGMHRMTFSPQAPTHSLIYNSGNYAVCSCLSLGLLSACLNCRFLCIDLSSPLGGEVIHGVSENLQLTRQARDMIQDTGTCAVSQQGYMQRMSLEDFIFEQTSYIITKEISAKPANLSI